MLTYEYEYSHEQLVSAPIAHQLSSDWFGSELLFAASKCWLWLKPVVFCVLKQMSALPTLPITSAW